MNKIYLTEAYAIDNKSILRILTQNKQINKSDPNYSYYSKLATWANENGKQQKLKNIDLTAIQLSDKGLIEKRKLTTKYTTLGHLLNDLKNLMDQEGKYTPSSELSRLIQQTTLDVLSKLSNTKASAAPEEAPENREPENENEPGADKNKTDEPELYEGMDWTAEKARRLEAGGTPSEVLDKFYNDYYLIEYAGGTDNNIVAKLKSLDKILIPEFNALGYNPDVNPFASFLKILIKNKFDIFEKLTYNTYGAIHNSFKDKHITGNMLGQKFDETNILFCSDLYNKNGLDIVNYLDLQKQTLAAGKNSDIKNLIAKIFIQQDVEGETYDKKVNNLKKLSSPVLPGADGAKLKSEPEIRELYRNLFGHEAKNKENDDLTQIVNETENDIILDMIYYLKSQYEAVLDDEDEAEIVKWLEAFNYTRNTTKIEISKKILSRYSKMRSAQTVLSLIGKLEAKKRKEAKK